MSWKRIATYALGGVLVGVGSFVPGANAVLVTAGVGLIGFATRWPGDQPRPRPRRDSSPELPEPVDTTEHVTARAKPPKR